MLRYARDMSLLFFSYFPSPVKVFFYRLMGAKIGGNVYIGVGSYLLPFGFNFKGIQIGDDCIIRENVRIMARTFTMGNNAEIKENSKIWGQSSFAMGNHSYVEQNVLIDLRRDVSLGNISSIGAGTYIYTHGAWNSALEGYPVKFAPVEIGDKVWVAACCLLMPGVTIGTNSIIGAKSTVLANVPADSLVAGNPAKVIRKGVQRKLSFEDKNKIVLAMLDEFISLASGAVVDRQGQEVVISLERSSFFHLSRIKFTVHYVPKLDKQKIDRYSKSSRVIFISLEPDEYAIDQCKKTGSGWIDLSAVKCGNLEGGLGRQLVNIMNRYGIILEEH